MLRKRFFTAPAAAAVALALGLGGAIVTTTAATATGPSTPVCIAADAYTEVTPDIEYPAVGEPTMTVVNPDYVAATPSIWQNFSPNNEQGTFIGAPSHPVDDRGTWNHQDKEIPPGQAGPDGVYSNGNDAKGGNWFYRQAAKPAVGEPTITVDNPDYVPAYTEDVPDIEHPAVVCPPTDEEPVVDPVDCTMTASTVTSSVGVGTASFTISGLENCLPIPVNFSTYDLPGGEVLPYDEQVLIEHAPRDGAGEGNLYGPGSYTLMADLTCNWQADLYKGAPKDTAPHDGLFYLDGFGIGWSYSENNDCTPVIPEQPAAEVRLADREVVDCETLTVTVMTTRYETPYVLDGDVWVLGTEAQVGDEVPSSERAATIEECPVDEQPADDVETSDWVVSVIDCDAETVTETRTITTTSYELVDREWVAGEPVETVETRDRPMTDVELDLYCPVELEPNALEVVDEWVVSETDCDTETVTETQTTTTTPYVLVDRAWVLGEPVVSSEERTRPMTDAELDEYCPVELEPAAVEVLGEWTVSDSDCDTTTVTETRTVSTTPYVLVDRQWVAGATVETTEDRVRAMTDAERTELCPEVPVTPVTPVTPLGDLPTLALTDPPTLALTGPSDALGGLGIAGLVTLMAGLGLVLLRRPQTASVED